MTVELDGRLMTDRGTAHDLLKQQLNLPDYYGRNLDALYDLLTERADPMLIRVIHVKTMEAQLGRYGTALLNTLWQAAEGMPNLEIEIIEEER